MRYPITLNEPSCCPFCKNTLVANIIKPLGKDGTLNLYNPKHAMEEIYLHCIECNRSYNGFEFKFGEDTYYTLDIESTKIKIKEQLEKSCLIKVKRINPLYKE